jgi:hypothetical protein
MVHPAVTRALATAHIEDLHRGAERDRQIRLARRVVHEPRVAANPIAVLRSASTRLRGRRAPKPDGVRHRVGSGPPRPSPGRRAGRSSS